MRKPFFSRFIQFLDMIAYIKHSLSSFLSILRGNGCMSWTFFHHFFISSSETTDGWSPSLSKQQNPLWRFAFCGSLGAFGWESHFLFALINFQTWFCQATRYFLSYVWVTLFLSYFQPIATIILFKRSLHTSVDIIYSLTGTGLYGLIACILYVPFTFVTVLRSRYLAWFFNH